MRDNDHIKRQYEDLYAADPEGVFGRVKHAPDLLVTELVALLPPNAHVLDLGTGQGRNALFLARQGFSVEARDISTTGLAQFARVVEAEKLPIDLIEADARTPLVKSYDAILALFFFHHIPREDGPAMLEMLKSHTIPGGVHVIAAFTQEGDFFQDNPETHEWFIRKGELSELYQDWHIEEYRERRAAAHEKRADGREMSNVSVRLIARKPRSILSAHEDSHHREIPAN